ncbi:VOC family protein [Bacillus niameyensis]|uniref:VOC family protein n=1 Tax=Bacillus niameyensis TaxID=1522308 RepID=UPI000784B9B8|nr:VOC family protein [Bacillus niameyensis]
MEFRFDHLVYVAKEPERLVSAFEPLGLHIIGGGRHERWGSYNSLSYFGLSYIEFLGIDNWEIATRENENRLIAQTANMLKKGEEGPLRVALRTDDIEKSAYYLREKGIQVYGPYPGERTKKDGKIIKWSLLFPENSYDSKLVYPFIIQWDQSDEERLEELQANQFTGQHAIGNGSPTFSHVGFAVHDLGDTVKQWSQLFGLHCSEVFFNETLQARCQVLIVTGTRLLFCEPTGQGIVQEVLQTRGEVPFFVQLTDTGQADSIQTGNCFWNFE